MDVCNRETNSNYIKVQRENHFDELMTSLKCFAYGGILTDLALVTGVETLHMHHVVLSCFSSYFECITENENIKYFVCTDHKKKILEALVDYIYTGTVCIPNIHKRQLALAATSLHVKDFTSTSVSNNDNATIFCPNHKTELCLKIWDSRQNSYKSDVIFVIDNKHKVYAHACILGACSSFLLQIFTKHGVKKRKPYVVALPNVEKQDLELVLEFCYKGEVTIPFQDIQSVYNVADLLRVEALCKILITIHPAAVTLTVPSKKKKTSAINIIRTSAIPTALSDLLRYERLVDVFIFTNEKLFKAHSVILSIYSVFFKHLAKYLNYDLKDVFVLVKDFGTKNMEALLDYMYTGEAKFEGSAEEFCESMSEWLDLNVLPVSSSNIAPQAVACIKNLEHNEDNQEYFSNDDCVLPQEAAKGNNHNTKSGERKIEVMQKNEQSKNCYTQADEFANCKDVPEHTRNKKSESEHVSGDSTGMQTFENQGTGGKSREEKDEENDKNISHYVTGDREKCVETCDKLKTQQTNKNESEIGSIHQEGSTHKEYMPSVEEQVNEKYAEKVNSNQIVTSYSSDYEYSEEASVSREEHVSENKNTNAYAAFVTSNHMEDTEKDGSEIDDPDTKAVEQGGKCRQKPADKRIRNLKNVIVKQSSRYECQTCKMKFGTRWDFKTHLSVHPKGSVLQCEYCEKEFSRPSEFNEHIQTHTGARPFQCKVCGMSFTGKNTLRKHEHIHTKDKPKEFKCDICIKTFSRKQYLQEHYRTHTGSKPYECDVCHKTFVGKTGLNHHKKTHKNEDEKKSAMCEICGKSFTRHALWTHMKHHNKEHKCEFCSKCFATTAALKTHVAGTHLGHSWHHCNTCGKGFIRKGHLNRHMKTHEEGNNTQSFTCSRCPSKFKEESHLKAHVKRKHMEQSSKSPTCGICGKQFSTHSRLIYHQQLHFHERPHRCNMCGKTFAVPYQLRDHTRLHHSDERLFHCSVCKKKCATQGLLNRHLLTHRPTFTPKSKPPGIVTCNSCNKTFPTKLALSNHSRTHNFSRPFQCNICRKAFRYQDSLLKHLRLHPNEPSSETTATKELPCIYTIQVCRPSFIPITSEMVENQTYSSEHVTNELSTNDVIDNSVQHINSSMCLDVSEKTTNEISLLHLKPVDEAFLSSAVLQSEQIGYLQTVGADPICSVPIEKAPESTVTSLPRRPYSIIIDGNLCCNNALSTDGDITPSVSLLPDRSELVDIPHVDVGLPVSSHILLPMAPAANMVELDHMAAPAPPARTSHEEFVGTLTKEFSL